MIKRIIIVIGMISLLNPTSLLAQENESEEKNSSFTLNLGVGNLIRQDLIFTPLIHKAWSPLNAVLNYRHSGKLEHQAYIKFSSYDFSVLKPYSYYWDTPDETETSGRHNMDLIAINYSLGKAVYNTDKLKFTIGGRWRNRLQAGYYTYGVYWLGMFSYNFSFGTDVWTNLNYQINEKQYMEANLALPLFSYNARSPYMSQNDDYFENTMSGKALLTVVKLIEDGELQSWGESQSVDLDLSYYYTLSDKWDIGASYWFAANFNQVPRKLTSFENGIYISGKLKF